MFGETARQCVQWIVILFNFTGNIASLQVISSQAAPLLAIWCVAFAVCVSCVIRVLFLLIFARRLDRFPKQLAGSDPSVMQVSHPHLILTSSSESSPDPHLILSQCDSSVPVVGDGDGSGFDPTYQSNNDCVAVRLCTMLRPF